MNISLPTEFVDFLGRLFFRRLNAVRVAMGCLLALGGQFGAEAEITRITIDSIQSPAYSGQSFGQVGTYEIFTGHAYGEIDPNDPHNQIITDINLAPTNSHGMVEYTNTFTLQKPVDLSKANGVMLYFAPNRGNRIGFNSVAWESGTTFLAKQGYMILHSGWQGDVTPSSGLETITVPVARNPDGSSVTGVVLASFVNMANGTKTLSLPSRQPAASLDTTQATLTWQTSFDGPATVIPSTNWAFSDSTSVAFPGQPSATKISVQGGFYSTNLYELSYTTKDPPVLGIGFAATRDIVSFFRYETSSVTNPLAGRVTNVIARGDSQSGNFLKTFIHLGFNADESGRIVWDGANPHIAGRQTPLNFRFAIPGGAATLYEPGSETTLWWGDYVDTARGQSNASSMLARSQASGTVPKIFETFGSAEVWGLRMSPGLVGTSADVDIPLPNNVRRYYFPGTAHGGGSGGFNANLTTPASGYVLPANPNPHSETMRALMVALTDWVTKNTAPPASVYPRLTNGQLAAPDHTSMGFPVIPGKPLPDDKINPFYDYDFGPQFNYRDLSGVITIQPPTIKGILPMLVPKVDADGNEIGGLGSTLHQAPLGSYLGWNVYSSGFYQGQGRGYMGGFIPFAQTQSQRIATGDPRLSLEERYQTHAGYVLAVSNATQTLIAQGFLLSEDASNLVQQAQNSSVLTVTGGYWTGDTSTAWNDPLNWSGNTFPTNSATVNDAVNLPVISVNPVFNTTNLYIGDAAPGTLVISNGVLAVSSEVAVGRNGGTGTVNMNGGTFAKGSGSEFNIGNGDGSTGIWNMTNGTITSAVTTRIGNIGSEATFNMYGGTLSASNYLSIGRDATGVLNLYGGTITKSVSGSTTVVVGGGGSGSGTGTINLNGGTLDVSGATVQVAYGTGSPEGTVNLDGGQMLANILSVDGGSGTINLSTNGTLKVMNCIRRTSGTGVFNFDGGTLVAGGSAAYVSNLTAVNVLAGGAIIDTTNNTLTLKTSLLDGDGLAGGLTKLGSGMLFINGVTTASTNTYTGTTAVNAGVLGGNALFSGSMTVASGGGLAPGASATVGTLTVGGSLTLNHNSTNIYDFNSTTNDLVVVSNTLTLGATPKFKLVQETTGTSFSAVGSYKLIKHGGNAPGLDSTWTTASTNNPHIANPTSGFTYQFATSGGYLTLVIGSTNIISSTNIGTWSVDNNGNWSAAGNWTASSGTMPPRNAGDTAIFGTGTSLRTVTLDANETVGVITMNNPNSFVIAGLNTLTLDRTNGGAAITVTDGSANAIQTGVALNDNLAVSVSSGKSLSLSGNIANGSGTKTLSVTGAGTLALSGNNSYGPATAAVGTTVSGGGILQLGSSTALGSGDVTNTASCTIQSGAPNVSVTNKFMIGASTTVNVGNDGANNLALAGAISGSGALTKVGANRVTLGATNSYSGNTTVSAGTLNVAAGAVISLPTTATITVGSVSNIPAVMTNSGTISQSGATISGFNIGSGHDLIGTFNMDGGTLNINTAVRIGSEPATGGIDPGNGTFNLSGGTVTSGSFWQIGRNFGVGVMNMTGGDFFLANNNYIAIANSGSTGTFNMSGGNLTTTNQILVAYANGTAGSVGVWNLSGTAQVVHGGPKRFVVGLGGNGTLNQSGGSFNYTVSGVAAEIGVNSTFAGTGVWNMSAGTATLASQLIIGDGAGSVGTLKLTNTAAMFAAGIQLGASTGTGTLNLNGGTLTANGAITNGSGSGTFIFNGGTLKAGVSSASFMSGLTAATVSSGGAIIDSGTNTITIGQPLLNGGGSGGLTKLGSGMLTLSGTNTYAGTTTVSNGALLVDGSVSGPVTVKAGATLGGNGSVVGVVTVEANGIIGAGSSIGKLTLGSSPILGGTVVAELNRNGGVFTNDLINTGSNPLTYGGTLVLTNTGAPLQVNDSFKLFNTSGGYGGSFTLVSQTPGQHVNWNTAGLNVNGTISVATVGPPLPTAPTNLVFSAFGNQVNLSWPPNYTGWLLESNGVSLVNTGAWATVAGSGATNQVILTVDRSKTNVFFRMRLP